MCIGIIVASESRYPDRSRVLLLYVHKGLFFSFCPRRPAHRFRGRNEKHTSLSFAVITDFRTHVIGDVRRIVVLASCTRLISRGGIGRQAAEKSVYVTATLYACSNSLPNTKFLKARVGSAEENRF